MNCGSNVRKNTPSFGFSSADSRPWSQARCHGTSTTSGSPLVRLEGVARSKGGDAEVDQVRRTGQLEDREGDGRRRQQRRDTERSRDRPTEDARADAERRGEARRPPVPEHVACDQGHVRSRDDHDRDRDADEGQQLFDIVQLRSVVDGAHRGDPQPQPLARSLPTLRPNRDIVGPAAGPTAARASRSVPSTPVRIGCPDHAGRDG